MAETVEPAVASVGAVAAPERWTAQKREMVLFAAATAAAWAHTIDEIRIGELIALPFAVANVALVAAWTRLSAGRRALASIAFGLLWALAVVPYHVVPLLEGAVTGQNVSGLSRVVGGVTMVAVGIAVLRRREARDEQSR